MPLGCSCKLARKVAAASEENPLFSQASISLTSSKVDQPAAGKPTQYPHAHLLDNDGECLRFHVSGRAKTHGLNNITGILDQLEDALDNATMVMAVPVEVGAEAVDGAYRAEACMRLGAAALVQSASMICSTALIACGS